MTHMCKHVIDLSNRFKNIIKNKGVFNDLVCVFFFIVIDCLSIAGSKWWQKCSFWPKMTFHHSLQIWSTDYSQPRLVVVNVSPAAVCVNI